MKYKYVLLIFLFCSAAIAGISSENEKQTGMEVPCAKIADECEALPKAEKDSRESPYLLTHDFLLFM